MVDANKTYVGFVEDNNDPEKIGRVKVKVMDVFDEIELEDIPWAMPWKDLNGNSFNIPEIGKVVMVVFDQGNVDSPEFIYADHYNINLENKIKKLSDVDYTSMKSLIFDHKTQVYVNESEGLKIDHKYNNINITENSVDINLKDNSRTLNLGDSSATQQAILGNHFMEWFDEFVDNLLGAKAGPYFGNLSAPVIPSPAMSNILLKYKTLRNTDFLSEHVNIVDNKKVKTVLNSDREDLAQYGDKWASTIEDNESTELRDEDFKPEEPEDEDPNIEMVLSYLETKGYKVNDDVGILNILTIRNKENGLISNKFDDEIKVVWKKESGNWEILEAPITTVPGYLEGFLELDDDDKLLANGQYVENVELSDDESFLYFKDCFVHINTKVDKYNWKSEKVKSSGVKILPANRKGSADYVFETASEGAQVFKNINHFNLFINLCKQQVNKYKKRTFTYTLINKSDFEKIILNPPASLPSVSLPSLPSLDTVIDNIKSDEISDLEKSIKEYTTIVNVINRIYKLNDKLANGQPLFKDFKGIFNDDEDRAVLRLKEVLGLKKSNGNWFNKLSIENLTDENKFTFKNQLNDLIKKTTTSKGIVYFLIPNLRPGEKAKFIKIDTDF